MEQRQSQFEYRISFFITPPFSDYIFKNSIAVPSLLLALKILKLNNLLARNIRKKDEITSQGNSGIQYDGLIRKSFLNIIPFKKIELELMNKIINRMNSINND